MAFQPSPPLPALYQPLVHPQGMCWLYLQGQAGTLGCGDTGQEGGTPLGTLIVQTVQTHPKTLSGHCHSPCLSVCPDSGSTQTQGCSARAKSTVPIAVPLPMAPVSQPRGSTQGLGGCEKGLGRCPRRGSSGAWQGRDGHEAPSWTLPPTSALHLCHCSTGPACPARGAGSSPLPASVSPPGWQ